MAYLPQLEQSKPQEKRGLFCSPLCPQCLTLCQAHGRQVTNRTKEINISICAYVYRERHKILKGIPKIINSDYGWVVKIHTLLYSSLHWCIVSHFYTKNFKKKRYNPFSYMLVCICMHVCVCMACMYVFWHLYLVI